MFIASPGGLDEERRAFKDIVREYNEADAGPRGVSFRAVGWEDTLGGLGRPQALINREVSDCDYCIVVLWDRWGSPPDSEDRSEYSSGTEEELAVARECVGNNDDPMADVLLLFKAVEPRHRSDPGPQLQKVLDFKAELESTKEVLYQSFDSLDRFRGIVRSHLARWLRDHESGVLTVGSGSEQSESLQDTPPSIVAPEDRYLRLKEAAQLREAGRFTDAEGIYASEITGSNDFVPFYEYGSFLIGLGRLDQADEMIRRAATLIPDTAEHRHTAAIHDALGTIAIHRGDFRKACREFRVAVENEKLSDVIGPSSLGNLGAALAQLGDAEGAAAVFREAMALDKEHGVHDAASSNLTSLAMLECRKGRYDEAQDLLREALAIVQAAGDERGLMTVKGNTGLVLRKQKDLPSAEAAFRESLNLARSLGDRAAMNNGLGNLANVLAEQGKDEEATRLNEELISDSQILGLRPVEARALSNLANLRTRVGEYEEAEALYMQALGLMEASAQVADVAMCYLNVGKLHEETGRSKSARDFFTSARRLYARTGDTARTDEVDSLLRKNLEGAGGTKPGDQHSGSPSSKGTADADRE